MTCAEVARLISAYLDGELDPVAATAIADHLALCRDCPPEAAALAELRSALRSLEAPPPAAVQRLRAWVTTMTATDREAATEPGSPDSSRFPPRHRAPRRPRHS